MAEIHRDYIIEFEPKVLYNEDSWRWGLARMAETGGK